MIGKEEFEKMFKSYMQLVGKPDLDFTIKFYYSHLKNADLADLKRALAFFSSRLKFASLAELMDECCLYKPLSMQEQKELEERYKEPKKVDGEVKTDYETLHGDNCFRYVSKEKTQENADIDFQKQVDEKLIKNGWEIKHVVLSSTGIEEDPINKTRCNVFVRIYLAYRK